MLEFATYLMSRDCKFSINDRRNLEAASFKVKLKFDVWGWNLLDGIVWSMEEVRFGGFDIVGDITTPSMFMIMRTKRHFFFPHKTIPRDDSLLLFHQLLQENSHFNPPLPPLLRPTFNRTQTGRWNEKKIRLEKSKETTKLHRRGGWATVNGPPFGGEELAPIKRPWKGWTKSVEWAQGES